MIKEELNLRIANLEFPFVDDIEQNADGSITLRTDGYVSKVDYCNNWNDLIPLAVEYGEWFYLGEDCAEIGIDDNGSGIETFTNGNPQLALAECLLKVLEAKASASYGICPLERNPRTLGADELEAKQ